MYTSQITRQTPTAFIILIDQSGSMAERVTFDDRVLTKAEAVAMAADMLIDELINRSRRDDGVRDYYDIAVIGYSGDGVESLLCEEEHFIRPSRLAGMPCRSESIIRERRLPDGQIQLSTIEHNHWIEPKAAGGTPMYEALTTAYNLVVEWCARPCNRNSYPPTVLNLTDGEASDANAEQLLSLARALKSQSTDDGPTLLINMHNCRMEDGRQGIIFPSSIDELPPQRYSRLLFEMSSTMPLLYHPDIRAIRGSDGESFKGMGYNCSINNIITMLNIGTISISTQ